MIVSVISVPQGYNEDELYVDLRSVFGHSLFLKCEGFNFAGSIKLKAATEMVEAAERDGVLTPGSVLIEPSSGNPLTPRSAATACSRRRR
jgi:N-(2-amino-2-carboxyethyl)-L-glutamate synthase